MSLPTPSPRKRGQASQHHTLADGAARRVQRPAPLRQAVYDAIVDLIVQGTLQRGQHLVENELAEYLGVSRQPVREALQRLQTDGWIDLRPAQGAFVHTPSEDEVDQLLGVRTVLETYSARLAAENATPEDVNRLWELQQDVWTLSGLMHELPMELPRRHEILRALERMLDVMDPEDVPGTAAAGREALAAAKIPLVAEDTGLDYGRSVYFHLSDGRVEVRSLKKGDRVL